MAASDHGRLLAERFQQAPIRLATALQGVRVFEVDLADVLVEREKMFRDLTGNGLMLDRVAVECDLVLQDIAEQLRCASFDASLETVFVLEGVSMYLEPAVNAKVFSALASLLGSPGSRLWVDVVDTAVVDRTAPQREVQSFVRGVEALGEPVIWGTSDAREYFARFGLNVESEAASDHYLPSDDPVFDLYRFCTVKTS